MSTSPRVAVAGAALAAIFVACGDGVARQWTRPVDLGPGYSGPWIGADGAGRAIVAWGERTGDVQTFWTTQFSEGSWSRPEALGRTAHPAIIGSAALVVRRDGTALFAWINGDDQAFSDVVVRRFHPERGWGAAERSPHRAEVFLLFAASDRLAHAVLTWSSFRGVWAWRNGPDGPLAPPENVGGFLGLPNVVGPILVNARGQAFVAWPELSDRTIDAQKGFRAARFDAGQGWSPPEWVLGPEPSAPFPRMSMDGEGNVLVVWDTNESSLLRYKRGDRGRGWYETGIVESGYRLAALSSGGDGAAVALLDRILPASQISTELWMKAYDPRNGWGATEQLPDAVSTGFRAGATLARAPGDRTFALWLTSDGTNVQVWVRELGRNVDARVRLETQPCAAGTPTPVFAQLVFDLEGRGTAAWITCGRLKVSRFLAEGS